MRAISVAAAAVIAVVGFALVQADAAPRPNIVVIMTDDQDDTGSLAIMPKTRRLLKQRGIHFTNSFVNFSSCCPSRSSFLTGLAAHNHGVVGNKPERDGGYEKFIERGHENDTLAVWLQSAGYTTALMGKYLNGYNRNVMPPDHVPPGWNEWRALKPPAYLSYDMNINGRIIHYGTGVVDYSTDVLAKAGKNFIDKNKDEPFFLLLVPNAPHTRGRGPALPAHRHRGALADLEFPRYGAAFNEKNVSDKPGYVQAIPPQDEEAVFDIAKRYQGARESLLAVDDMVETIVRALAHHKLLHKTVIIFTSDNGYMFGVHRLVGKGVPYEESIQVPLIISGPGIPKGEVRTQMVNNLDVVATIVELAGLTPSHPLDGKSLLPAIADANAPWRSAMLVQGIGPSNVRFFSVRTLGDIYTEYTSNFGDEQEYYDLTIDRHQLRNRAGSGPYQSIVSDRANLLATLKTCAGETCWVEGQINKSGNSSSLPDRTTVYRGPIPKTYRSRREYDLQQSLDE